MRKRLLALLLCVGLLLAGCSDSEEEQQQASVLSAEEYIAEYQNQEIVNLTQVEWKESEVEEPSLYYRQETYLSPVFQATGQKTWSVGEDYSEGYYSRLYLENNLPDQKEYIYRLDTININSLETKQVSFSILPDMGGPFQIAAVGEQVYILYEAYDQEGNLNQLWIASVEEDGSFSKSIDLLGFATEQELLPKANYAFQCTFQVCPEKELIYLIPYEETTLYVLSMEGELKYQFEGFGDKSQIYQYAKTEEGDCIFAAYDNASKDTVLFACQEGKVEELYRKQGDIRYYLQEFVSCDRYGNVTYLEKNSNIVNWNIATGKQEYLFKGSDTLFRSAKMIARNAEGKLVLLCNDCEGMSLNIYSPSGPAEQVELTLDTTFFWTMTLQEAIDRFEQTHPGVTIKQGEEVDDYSKRDIHMNQLYEKMSQGEGPDMIALLADDWKQFADGGALMDMTGVVDEEEYHLLTGLMDVGKIDGKQYYLPVDININSLVVKRSLWNQASWTVEDFLGVIEKKEQNGEDFFLLANWEGYCEADSLLSYFVMDISQSPFLDDNELKAYFDTELFRQVLECCKKYGEKANIHGKADIEDAEMIGQLKEGQVLGAFSNPYFGEFCKYGAGLKEDFNYIGYPTEGESGNLINGSNGIAVNTNSPHKDVIEEFLQCFYSYDYQMTWISYGVPMRTDILENNILEHTDLGDGVYVKLDANSVTRVAAKEDGTSFKNEYIDFLQNCGSKDERFGDIYSIIQEEAAAYFEGEKSVEEVQRLIQNRVTLYLNENF